MVYDRERDRVKYVAASSQVEAAVNARLRYGMIPYRTDHCKCLTSNERLAPSREWQRVVPKHLKNLRPNNKV
jgi:hypothetical protein